MIIAQSVHCSQESLREAIAVRTGTCTQLNEAVSRPLDLCLPRRSKRRRDFFDFRYLNLQVESRFYLGSMNEEKGQESSALDEAMVARIEVEGIGVAANEKEMTDSVTALARSARGQDRERGDVCDLRSAGHDGKEDRGSGACERKYGESCNHRHRNPTSLKTNWEATFAESADSTASA